MMLFVRAIKGKINYISLHRAGVDYTPRKRDGVYHSEFGVFDVTVGDDDTITATLDGQEPDSAVKVNDLYRFDFGDDPVDTETPTIAIAVSDGLFTGERLGG